jgi:hypothetical protein
LRGAALNAVLVAEEMNNNGALKALKKVEAWMVRTKLLSLEGRTWVRIDGGWRHTCTHACMVICFDCRPCIRLDSTCFLTVITRCKR